MINKSKKIYIVFLISFLSLSLGSFLFAQERPLEVEYPEMAGIKPETTAFPLPEYVKYIFNSAIILGGVIAFLALVYAGFRYSTSLGSPATQKEAKKQIQTALFGLSLLFLSWLILTTINPQLVVSKLPSLKPPVLPAVTPVFFPPAKEPGEFTIELKKYTELAEKVEKSSEKEVKAAKELKEAAQSCSCDKGKAECKEDHCLCEGDPCPKRGIMNTKKKELIDFSGELKGLNKSFWLGIEAIEKAKIKLEPEEEVKLFITTVNKLADLAFSQATNAQAMWWLGDRCKFEEGRCRYCSCKQCSEEKTAASVPMGPTNTKIRGCLCLGTPPCWQEACPANRIEANLADSEAVDKEIKILSQAIKDLTGKIKIREEKK